MKIAVTEDELTTLLASAPFARSYKFSLASAIEGQCTLLVPFQAAFERPDGIVSGPVFMAAADVAMWLAIKTKLGLADASLTAEMKTNFLSGAKNEDFRCTARVLKFGCRLILALPSASTIVARC